MKSAYHEGALNKEHAIQKKITPKIKPQNVCYCNNVEVFTKNDEN